MFRDVVWELLMELAASEQDTCDLGLPNEG
jgi:hypothetical protein